VSRSECALFFNVACLVLSMLM